MLHSSLFRGRPDAILFFPHLSIAGFDDLCSKREELSLQIKLEEEEKERLQHDIRSLSEKLSRVNESLAQKMAAHNTIDRTIAETEAAYTKVFVLIQVACLEVYLLTVLSHFAFFYYSIFTVSKLEGNVLTRDAGYDMYILRPKFKTVGLQKR